MPTPLFTADEKGKRKREKSSQECHPKESERSL
jgi:hypothetical protein